MITYSNKNDKCDRYLINVLNGLPKHLIHQLDKEHVISSHTQYWLILASFVRATEKLMLNC